VISIEKEKWFLNVFARITEFSDMTRQPIELKSIQNKKEVDSYRQSQLNADEVVRLLGTHNQYSLIMKFDKTLGWINSKYCEQISVTKWENICPSEKMSSTQFWDSWLGTPYLWGGLSKSGIDCSGLIQLYYLNVLGKILPKNSKDQRKSGISKNFSEIKNHDLVFCYRKNGDRIHHVAIFFEQKLWHARLSGVESQTIESFLDLYDIEEVIEPTVFLDPTRN
jgi:hypothetical protein